MQTIKLGIYRNRDLHFWILIRDLMKDAGEDLELRLFCSHDVLNMALHAGDIDIACAQSRMSLARENRAHGYNLQELAATYIEPWSIITDKRLTLSDLRKNGNVIVLPEDKADLGRALNILRDLQLISLDDGEDPLPNLSSVISNPFGMILIEESRDHILKALTNKAVTACLVPSEFKEDPKYQKKTHRCIFTESFHYKEKPNFPFMRILAVRNKEKQNSLYEQVVKIVNSKQAAAELRRLKHEHIILGFDEI